MFEFRSKLVPAVVGAASTLAVLLFTAPVTANGAIGRLTGGSPTATCQAIAPSDCTPKRLCSGGVSACDMNATTTNPAAVKNCKPDNNGQSCDAKNQNMGNCSTDKPNTCQ